MHPRRIESSSCLRSSSRYFWRRVSVDSPCSIASTNPGHGCSKTVMFGFLCKISVV